jgi:hypothetical protein
MKTLIVFIAVVSGTAFAQRQDEPIPFDDEAPVAPLAPLPKRESFDDSDDFSEIVRHRNTPFRTFARQDDPSVGISFDVHGGALWLDESKKGHHLRLALGARLTWEWSRTFLDDEYWRKAFFVDLTWNITQAKEGTELVYTKVTHNYLVLAPAFSLPFSNGLFAFFIQGGVGVFFLNSTLVVDYPTPIEASNQGVFLLGQYGAGFRMRISPDPQKALFIVLRAELTGYIHRYNHDIMASVGVGIGF